MMRMTLMCASLLMLVACSGPEEGRKTPLVRAEGDRLTLSEPDKADFLQIVAVDRQKQGILRLPGRLVWNEDKTVRLVPQLGGRVQRIAVDVGDRVKVGQALAVLGSADYGEAQADARKAAADLRVAEQAETRARELREAGIVAEKEWVQVQADALRARAEAERAKRRLNTLGGDGDGNYTLKSPLAGVVVARNLNPGMEFRPDQAGEPLFVVTDPASLWLQLDAAEEDVRFLKPGESLELEVKQFPGERFKGVIRRIADFVDPQTRTLKIRCEVANPDRRLKAEMFVHALVQVAGSDALSVPAAAVMLQGDQRYVLVEEGKGVFRRQAILAGPERDGMLEVREGLKATDKVVVEGNLNLARYLKSTAAKPTKQAKP